ncbi:RNA polymerase sigma factor [Tumebacillus permanentifrigoris]|uniref:RNA polymerase sigma factor n=1 Tax=Tumebacillus permanentifrigoris TaxID=378543 RepID=A0A316D983_9BACL|nr:RNA polymerase sigma factor [Tumebacillus permanentifrigoris]PWK13741.1 RNA polymerase RpoE-like sigma-24 subunit [Tumebacillus permanentifrigoris]
MHEASDQELIQGVQTGDDACYRLLVERYQSLVYTIALRMVRDRTEAEDIVQDVFLKAFRTLEHFREEASFKTWICKIATNRCIDWKRKHGVRQERTAQVEEAAWIPDTTVERPEQALVRRETQAEVRRLIEEMPEKYRKILILYHFQNMSYQDIADDQQISPRTVETRLYRAKQMMRTALRGGESDDTHERELAVEVSGGRSGRR